MDCHSVPGPIIRRMRFRSVILLGLVLQSVLYAQTPADTDHRPILAIARNTAKAGDLEKYELLLRNEARACARVGCPQSYLVFQSSADPNEMWSLTTYASEDDGKKVAAYYENSNLPLYRFPRMGMRWTRSGSGLTYRPDLSHGTQWKMAQDRLLIITTTKIPVVVDGTVFEGNNNTCIVVSPARDEADAIARSSSSDSVVIVLRPELSFPAKEWIDADPQLWVQPASAKDVRRVIAGDRTPQ